MELWSYNPMNILLITPIFYREEKAINFLSSILTSNYVNFNIKLVITVNACTENFKQYLIKYEKHWQFINGNIEIIYNEKNLGKGKSLNLAVSNNKDFNPDYIVSMDSDIIHVDTNWLHKSIQTFIDYNTHYKKDDLALVSPNMLKDEISMNNHYIDRINGYHIKIKHWKCWTSDKNTGIAGPCFIIKYDAWLKICGYYDGLYIGGNDAHMLYDLYNNKYKAVINKEIYFIHPKDSKDELQYRKWKDNMIGNAKTRPKTLPKHLSDYNGIVF